MKDFNEKDSCCSGSDCCDDSNDCCSDEFEGCSCGCGDEGEYINIEDVAEIAIDENGNVHLLVVGDDESNPQEYVMEFPSVEEAEAWVRETFGDEIFEQDDDE